VISDLHLGGAKTPDDASDSRGFCLCTQSRVLTEWIKTLTARAPSDPAVELVINGDLVDFLAEAGSVPMGERPFIASERDAAETFKVIVERERSFFDALGAFVGRGHRLVLLLGNHDLELCLPRVRQALMEALHVNGNNDFQFIYDNEAYVVADALIEHGNRYDEWNTVDHDALRRLRSWQSRRQPAETAPNFDPPAGSWLVADVINRIKSTYKFIDLLKPETGAVVPLLLALEPRCRSFLRNATWLRSVAWRHRMVAPAYPRFDGDIGSSGASPSGFVADLASTPSSSTSVDPLLYILEEAMPGEGARFLASIGPESAQRAGASSFAASDVAATPGSVERALAWARLMTANSERPLEDRLPALLLALRALQNDRTFDPSFETLPEFLRAATALCQGGFRFVIFGHTHLARRIPLESGGIYLNAGTWADLMRCPAEIAEGSARNAMEALRSYAADIACGRLAKWVWFRPTYVRLDIEGERVARAELLELESGVRPR